MERLSIHEAKLLAISGFGAKADHHRSIAEEWVSGLYSWDLCDGLGMKVFSKTSFALGKSKGMDG